MATLELRQGDTIKPAITRALVKQAVALDAALGDPSDLSPAKGKATRREPEPRQ